MSLGKSAGDQQQGGKRPAAKAPVAQARAVTARRYPLARRELRDQKRAINSLLAYEEAGDYSAPHMPERDFQVDVAEYRVDGHIMRNVGLWGDFDLTALYDQDPELFGYDELEKRDFPTADLWFVRDRLRVFDVASAYLRRCGEGSRTQCRLSVNSIGYRLIVSEGELVGYGPLLSRDDIAAATALMSPYPDWKPRGPVNARCTVNGVDCFQTIF